MFSLLKRKWKKLVLWLAKKKRSVWYGEMNVLKSVEPEERKKTEERLWWA